jgi:hypothetical protein
MKSNFYSFEIAYYLSIIECTIGTSPEAIVEFLFDDRLKVSLSACEIFDLVRIFLPFEIFSIGCAISLSSGSSPRGYDGVLAADHRLKEVWTVHLLSVFF